MALRAIPIWTRVNIHSKFWQQTGMVSGLIRQNLSGSLLIRPGGKQPGHIFYMDSYSLQEWSWLTGFREDD